MFSAITSIFAVFFFINRMQCSLSVKTYSLLLRRRSHFWSFPGERLSDERAGFTVRGTPRSRPVLPFPRSGTNNALRLILFEASGTAGSSPCADIGSCRHLTIRSDCHAVTPAMRSAVLSAPIMRHSKSGGVTECLLSRAVGGDSLLFHSNCSHSG